MKLALKPSPSPSKIQPILSGSTLKAQGREHEFDGGWDAVDKPKMVMTMNANNAYQGPSAADTKMYDQRTHVYMKNDMYIGADVPTERQTWLYNLVTGKLYKDTIYLVPGLERIFMEILSNASDNACMSRRKGIDPGKIDVVMNNSTISITNYGAPMPVEIHPDLINEQIYIPQISFGRLLTSRHYETDRHEAGTNGVGSKATNIYSKKFTAIIHDAIRHKKYTQTWTENMIHCHEPIIDHNYNGKISSVQIIYEADFARFGYQVPIGETGGYEPEAFSLFARHTLDVSLNAKIPVTFNGIGFNLSNIKDYGRLFFGDIVDEGVIHYQWPAGTEIIKKKKGTQVSKDPAILPEIELLALDTPDEGCHISFTNGIQNFDGGVHTNAAFKAVGDSTVKMINENIQKKLSRGKKNKELDAKEKRANSITIADVKPHISIILSAKLVNPKFTSQEKTSLTTPTPKIHIEDATLKPVGHWELIDRLYAAIDAKQFNNFTKNDGKSKGRFKTKNGMEANQAGKAERHKCMLYITEGNSGNSYAKYLTTLTPGGRDYIGTLPLRGKVLNVRNASLFQIDDNRELTALKKMLGLKHGMDYTIEANYKTLKYGAGLLIMADADVDGKHIEGLVLNFFEHCFPSLLAVNYCKGYLTPIVSVTLNSNTLKFYTDVGYEKWKESTPNYEKWKHKYYKGLGSSKNADIKANYEDPHIVNWFYDIDAPATYNLVFKTGREEDRKQWISNWRPLKEEVYYEQVPMSWHLNHEVILHSLDNIGRTIARIEDGLKLSQRKIIYAAMLKWKFWSKTKSYAELKIAQLSGFVADKSKYHHGENNLNETIVGMAQDYIGSNNISYFVKGGQLGCFDPNTPILTWSGEIKLAKDITMNHVLVGDDGTPRHITNLVEGIDQMYDIKQARGETYRVNSQHILTLQVPSHKRIYLKESTNRWMIQYFDLEQQKIIEKTFGYGPKSKQNKEQAEKSVIDFANTIPDNNIFDINLQVYLSYPKSKQELFKSLKITQPINWPKQDVPIDPYIMGMWLGDGYKNGKGFASADSELVKEWVIYSDRIGAEVTHTPNSNGNEGYQYGIRRRGAVTGYQAITPVGHQDHSSKTCNGCLTSAKEHPACDWVYENKNNEPFREYDGVTEDGKLRDDLNPFVQILKKYNIHDNKEVLGVYMINDEETRLQLLAGLIDTDGCLKHPDVESQQSFEITQDIKTHEQILDSAEFIAKSLGFRTTVSMSGDQKCLLITGDIFRIPTRLTRKKATRNEKSGRHLWGGKITVTPVGQGIYVGWGLDGNERFLHADFTVLHNTRHELGKDAAQTRYTCTQPMPLLSYLYSKKDVPILKYLEDEGESVEPETYLPIIPMILANGVCSIATGWSSFIPCHNPLDLVKWLKLRLQDSPNLPVLNPYYRGFTGTIELIDRSKKGVKTVLQPSEDTAENAKIEEHKEEEDNDDDEELPEEFEDEENEMPENNRQLLTMKMYGKFEVRNNGDIIITEMPIGRSPFKYHKWLETLIEQKKIKDFRDLSGDDLVYFEIYGYVGTPTFKSLKLERNVGMSNMVVLDENNKPVRFDNAAAIAEKFYQLRLPYYQKRKDYMMQKLVEEITTMKHKMLFIGEVLSDRIIIKNGDEDLIHSQMDALGIPYKIYDGSMRSINNRQIGLLEKSIAVKEQEIIQLQQTCIKSMMLFELDEFEKVYRREYKIKDETVKLNIGGKKSLGTLGNLGNTLVNSPMPANFPKSAVVAKKVQTSNNNKYNVPKNPPKTTKTATIKVNDNIQTEQPKTLSLRINK